MIMATHDLNNETNERGNSVSFLKTLWNKFVKWLSTILATSTIEGSGSLETLSSTSSDTAEAEGSSWGLKEGYEILTTEQIMEYRANLIRDVSSEIQMPKPYAQILLNHFKWNKQKLMKKFHSRPEKKIFRDTRILLPPEDNHSGGTLTKSEEEEEQTTSECEICFSTTSTLTVSGLECGHLFCAQCWVEYLTTKIMDGRLSEPIQCPGSCKFLVDDGVVMNLIEDPRVKLRYQHLITNSFVQCNPLMRWCSAAGCNYVVKIASAGANRVKCKCGHAYCFGCAKDWHDPIGCSLVRKWIKKSNDEESKSINWILRNTKECPKCFATVQKIYGCDRMRCSICGLQFCWNCLFPLSRHIFFTYQCRNVFAEATTQRKNKVAYEAYLGYFKAFTHHAQSLKCERQQLYAKMEERDDASQVLKDAVDILCDCRRTLAYAFVFAYFLGEEKKGQDKWLKAYLKDLEKATETLSEYLKGEIWTKNLPDITKKVLDKCSYGENKRNIILDHVRKNGKLVSSQ